MSKKTSGGFKAAKNYVPGGPKGAGKKSGSRSPGHRGFNPDAAASSGKKARWSEDDRAARSSYGDRPSRGGAYDQRAERPARDGSARGERPGRGYSSENRGGYSENRGGERRGGFEGNRGGGYGDRNARGGDTRGGYGDRNTRGGDSRGGYEGNRGGERRGGFEGNRGGGYGDRNTRGGDSRGGYEGNRGGERRGGFEGNRGGGYADRNDRGARSFDRNDRAPRSFDRNDRPARSFDRDDRAPRRNDRDDRAPRSFDRNDRAPRSFDRNDRAPRSFDRNDRAPRRDFDGGRPARSFDRDDRAPRRNDRDDRAPRSFDRNDRAPRSFDRDDRAPRTFDRADRSDRAPRRDSESRGGDRGARGGYDSRSTDRGARGGYEGRPSAQQRDSDYYPKRDHTAASFASHDDVKLERLEAIATTAAEVDGVSFGDLGIGDNIERQLASMGALAPFPIQAATIPDVLAGKDVLGRGRTGSGKTIAFGAPVVERLMENNGAKGRKHGRAPRALILAPTRELAMQIDRTIQPIARSVGLFTTTIFGGVPQHKQVTGIQRGTDIIIATPGRLEDLVEQGRLDLSNITITVLDEADHMCDLGFLEPVQRILRQVAPGGQRLLFSATLDKGVAQLVSEFLVDPSVHEVAGEDQASSTIDHRVLLIEQRDKRAIIEQLAGGEGKTLVFARTRAFAEELADLLDDAGIPATSLHGDLNQSRRTRNLQLLTSGRVNVLVATDVAARGIHVDDIGLVIQADAPDEYKTYLHRSGRTGRAGKRGTVVTLINRSRRRRMEELLGRAEIDAEVVSANPGDQIVDSLMSQAIGN